MKTCSASICYVLSLLHLAAAANLRRQPGVAVGIGSAEKTSATSAPVDNDAPEYLLTLQNYKGVQYYAPISLNNQELAAVYDTGSFEVMAMSTLCTACQVPPPQKKYDNTSSTTFVKGNTAIQNHHFAGGLVVAKQDYETVHIGDLGRAFTVKDMPFWQVVHTDMRVWMSNKAHFTAIVGLGHRTIVPDTPADQKPVDSLLERTNTNRFAICLEKGANKPGHITFNPKMYSNPAFKRVPVIGKNHWAVQLSEVSSFNGQTTDAVCGASPCIAIVDSGTSLLGIPPSGVPLIMNIINKIKQDCTGLDLLPDLVFNLGGQKFALPASAYVVKFQHKNEIKCLPAFTDFDMHSAQGDVWILGMPFLRHFYTVFDRTEPSIYVADQGDNCQPIVNDITTKLANTSFATARTQQELTIADTSEAMLPSWALQFSNHSILDI